MNDQRIRNPAKLAEYFGYLDDLRAIATVNMFGAAPYLREGFGLDRGDAETVLRSWMKLSRDKPASERAALAIEAMDKHDDGKAGKQ